MIKHCFLLSLLFICISCSLTYTQEEPEVDNVPEIIFDDVQFRRYENGRQTSELSADRLEQYRNDDALYSRSSRFKTFNDDGSLSAEGSCNYLSADTGADRYTLIGNIQIVSYDEYLSLSAGNLKWNGKTEQLVTGSGDEVSVSRYQDSGEGNSVRLSGSGFSASGISRSFQFSGPVSGTIITGKSENSGVVEVSGENPAGSADGSKGGGQ